MKLLHWINKVPHWINKVPHWINKVLHWINKLLHWIDDQLSTAENFLLVMLVVVMVTLAFLLVVLRAAFNTGIDEGDEFLRYLVLLTAFFGAAQASRRQKHINIDVLTKLLKDSHKRFASLFVNAFSFITALFLARAAWYYVMNLDDSNTIFGINIWIYQAVIPLGFLLMSYRFFLHFLDTLMQIAGRKRA